MVLPSSQASDVQRVVSEGGCTCHGHSSLQARRHASLPAELSSFVGRGAQIDDIASCLRTERLVTLTGRGGIGKTRLALQVARGIRSEFALCAWAALSAATHAADVCRAVTSAVRGFESPTTESVEALATVIGDQNAIVIVDNCEQVIAACADLVSRLLELCPGLRVLATSREALGVAGEVVHAVPPLAVADGSDDPALTEAVLLFFERALARDTDLQPTPERRAIVTRICGALDGVPLAIELAAACTSCMTLAEIDDRLADVLGLLRLGARAAPARQRSMRASIDWSHRLLQPDEQLLLRRLAVFEADFTLAAAQAVSAFDGLATSEIVFVLERLVAQSLVHASKRGSTTHFYVWLPVRQYALEQLKHAGEAARVQARLVAAANRRASHLPVERRPARAKAPVERTGVLSEREHDVVSLIAGGRSNREIADELVITRKTAEAHVSHILTKLGLYSRVQIATWSLHQSAAAGAG
jgi:predicted ATPase